MTLELGTRVISEWNNDQQIGTVVLRLGTDGDFVTWNNEILFMEDLIEHANVTLKDMDDFIVLYDNGGYEWGYDGDGDFVEVTE